jgi:hypothetical protein
LTADKRQEVEKYADMCAATITLLGFLARLWTAFGTFLNPDEALHFRLANQPSLALAYKESLTAAHPPLLTILLYFWRMPGTTELWLRLPSVLAGAIFCWMFYKWLSKAAGQLTGLMGLLFVAFLPPIVVLAAEVRQYSLLLAFLASALFFLDEAFAKNSALRMAVFSLCLYLAMSFHYSAFWFAAALGVYALFRIFTQHPPARVVGAWTIGQLGALALALVFYKTHLSKLGVNDSRTGLLGWMSGAYLRHSFFDRAHDNALQYVVGHSFGVFQYFFGQLAVGDVMGLVFIAGVLLLLRGKGIPENPMASRRLGLLLVLPFAITVAVALAHFYPYGGTRHIAFLIIPAIAGVSVAINRWSSGKWVRGLALTVFILVACIAFGKPRRPRMERADQNQAHMSSAMEFLRHNVDPSQPIFVDYQTELVLGHYLCQQHPVSLEATPADFEQFSCGGRRVVSTDYKTEWMFDADNFPKDWQLFVQAYGLKPEQSVWVFQTGWEVDLPTGLQKHFAEFHGSHFTSFGRNTAIFRMTVGQPMPAATPHAGKPYFPTGGISSPSARRVISSGTFRPSFLMTTPKLPE